MKRSTVFFLFGILTLQVVVLAWVGQPLLCECGTIKLWHGDIFSIENSQQISDWYSFSHVIHGFLFYALMRLFFPKQPLDVRFLGALSLEVGWELLENSPIIIDRYRQTALALGYTGDSVVNSVFDSIFMIAGFGLAARLKARTVVGLALFMELFTLFMVRDNLALNILDIVHPIPVIEEWQAELAE